MMGIECQNSQGEDGPECRRKSEQLSICGANLYIKKLVACCFVHSFNFFSYCLYLDRSRCGEAMPCSAMIKWNANGADDIRWGLPAVRRRLCAGNGQHVLGVMRAVRVPVRSGVRLQQTVRLRWRRLFTGSSPCMRHPAIRRVRSVRRPVSGCRHPCLSGASLCGRPRP